MEKHRQELQHKMQLHAEHQEKVDTELNEAVLAFKNEQQQQFA